MGHETKTNTPAVEMLEASGVNFERHYFEYEEKGGTKVSSTKLGVSEHIVIKTLIFANERHEALIVLMHGDRNVDTKRLAQQTGAKKISPVKPDVAFTHTGYQVGGISPFGTKEKLPLYVERSILSLPKILINGGGRGFLVSLSTEELVRVLNPTPVDVAQVKK
jgi:Cys-tRNA(Pro) deacylase